MEQDLFTEAFIAPERYQALPGEVDFVYRSICMVLAGKAAEVDWDRFGLDEWRLLARMSQADAEGVGPMLYWIFKDGPWPLQMPAVVAEHLKKTYYNTLAQNTLMYKELARILEALDSAEIPVIVLKGAALAVTIYKDIGLRPMGDLDLLVKPEDLRKAWKIIESLNYQVLSTNTEVVLRNFDGPEIGVDLHWCIVSGYENKSSSIDWFSKNLVSFPIPFTSLEAKALSPSFHLPYIISHSLDADYLRAMYDIFLLSGSPEICPKEVVNFAKEASWEGLLIRKLKKVEETFRETRAIKAVSSYVFSSELPKRVSRTTVIFNAWRLIELRLILLLLGRILIPTRRYLEWRYKRKIKMALPFWVIYRWIDLVFDFSKTIIQKNIFQASSTSTRTTV